MSWSWQDKKDFKRPRLKRGLQSQSNLGGYKLISLMDLWDEDIKPFIEQLQLTSFRTLRTSPIAESRPKDIITPLMAEIYAYALIIFPSIHSLIYLHKIPSKCRQAGRLWCQAAKAQVLCTYNPSFVFSYHHKRARAHARQYANKKPAKLRRQAVIENHHKPCHVKSS